MEIVENNWQQNERKKRKELDHLQYLKYVSVRQTGWEERLCLHKAGEVVRKYSLSQKGTYFYSLYTLTHCKLPQQIIQHLPNMNLKTLHVCEEIKRK